MVKRWSPSLQPTGQRIYVSCREHGEEFDNAFKETIEKEMASTNKTGKRKRNNIDTYNDLNEGELIIKEGVLSW